MIQKVQNFKVVKGDVSAILEKALKSKIEQTAPKPNNLIAKVKGLFASLKNDLNLTLSFPNP